MLDALNRVYFNPARVPKHYYHPRISPERQPSADGAGSVALPEHEANLSCELYRICEEALSGIHLVMAHLATEVFLVTKGFLVTAAMTDSMVHAK